MRQRVMIAIALASSPKLLLADEPTTALDVTIQDQILKLILDLRDRFGMSVVFVTHDLGVVAATCDRMAVMYAGRIVETGGVGEVFAAPRHPYTRGLLGSVPRARRRAHHADVDRGNAAEPDANCRPAARFIRAAASRPIAAAPSARRSKPSPTSRRSPASTIGRSPRWRRRHDAGPAAPLISVEGICQALSACRRRWPACLPAGRPRSFMR